MIFVNRTNEARVTLHEMEKVLEKCDKCPQLVKTRKRVVAGAGSPHAATMFIGLAPGRNGADITGVPFTRDPSGKIFREMVAEMSDLDFYVTNLVKCVPIDQQGRNRSPSHREILNCFEYVENEIALVDPRVIVLLGRTATKTFLRDIGTMHTVHNKPIDDNGRWIIPFLHPGYVVRGGYTKAEYIKDFCELALFIKKVIQ